ncbi:serine/threonine-protein phosphatase 6 regulatory ankyrin repeat subunit B-like [Branchiostoma floridae]|uniref:Serine/threonine-protein phosphatase 6 regulatory ankyrin repeat subunit B-like n=1 Tax=Branchiostoma floridae TaxID=7739 RepID=A0A9J7HTN4_BRAFL|nr:serine/threonine-protein phosphatase 6 regulatory ankyrin repeat subunit B-like [Branchiostoma floridae]
MNVADLFGAASNGDCDKIRSLLEEGMDVDAKDEDDHGCTALHHAAKAGHCPAIELLLDRGAKIDAINTKGMTALHYAAMNCHCAAIALLLDQGADVEIWDHDCRTALHFAASSDERMSSPQPLYKFVFGCADYSHHLQVSPEKHRCDAISLLLDGGADMDFKDRYDYTPLHYDAYEGDNDAIRLLLNRGTEFHEQNIYGQTVLHITAFHGHNDTVKLWLDRGVDIAAMDNMCRTALAVAARHGHHETVKLLCSRDGNLAAKGTHDSCTPLLDAARNGYCKVIDVSLTLAVTLGENCSGNTALHAAIPHGGLKTVTHLLGLGVEVNARNKDGKDGGWTALDHALHWEDFTIA